ncbi:GtrA family protein, partial [Streptomyces griseus]|uniref:GtrA family protein n=1 Tax=Streptomyces griseus TaxID=1911 RepID=UPI00214AAC7C
VRRAARAAGGGAALDPSTGAILALVSTPSYDPERLSGTGSAVTDAWARPNAATSMPMLNRAIRQTYPPGPTFKTLTAAAALAERVVTAADPAPAPPSGTGAPSRSRTVRQFGSFLLIGCVNTAVYLGIYASLNRFIPYLTAHVIGYAVSIVCSFLLNSYVTCRTRPTWHAFVRYPISSLVNLVASGALLYGAVGVLGMDKNLAALAAGVLVTPVSFLLARWAITSGRRKADTAVRTAGPPPGRPAPEPLPTRSSREG